MSKALKFDFDKVALKKGVSCIVLLVVFAGCRGAGEANAPRADSDDQKREQTLRLKKQCAIVGDEFDQKIRTEGLDPYRGLGMPTTLREVFYSPSRDSCVCEVMAADDPRGGALLALVDCLTREGLASYHIEVGGPAGQELAWQQRKDALKATVKR